MIAIGGLINSTVDIVREKIEDKDETYIKNLAQEQVDCGAHIIDVNAGAFVWDETENLIWLVNTVQEQINKPLALDSPSAEALRKATEVHKGIPVINSITAEEKRYNEVLPIVKQFNTEVIALCMSDDGMPETVDDRLKVTDKLLNNFEKEGIDLTKVYLDPIIKPIGVNSKDGKMALQTIQAINSWETDVHITCGLGNISYGLPHRKLLNQALLIMAMERGMDSAIIDPTDKYLMKLIKAAEVLINRDAYETEYLKAARAGELD